MTTQWSLLDGLEPVAPNTGPFPKAPFLSAVERHTHPGVDVSVVHIDGGTVAVALDREVVRFAGPAHLTDYHSPLGERPGEAIRAALADFPGRRFRLDSMPVEATLAVTAALEGHVADLVVVEDESTAVLTLPDTYDDWLMSLAKKERHEVRRKRRRFEATFGEISIVRSGIEAIDAFCTMHRGSTGTKGTFMTAPMQDFFADLLDQAGASIHSLVCDGRIRASAFGFETSDGYYYYNSAYDQDAAMASPGVVLFSAMIEQQIARGVKVFDFLKGDESYKYRHGAEVRMLYAVEGTIT